MIIVNSGYMKCVQYMNTNTNLMNVSCKLLHETNLGNDLIIRRLAEY